MNGMRFEQKLAMLCEQKGWNQSRLAQLLAKEGRTTISKNTVSRWFSGAVRPFDEWFLPLARTLGVDCEYLVDDSQDEPPAPALTEDESAILQMVRDLGLSRAAATRGLAIAAAQAEPVPRRIIVGPERDETAHDDAIERARNRPVRVEPKPAKDPQSKR